MQSSVVQEELQGWIKRSRLFGTITAHVLLDQLDRPWRSWDRDPGWEACYSSLDPLRRVRKRGGVFKMSFFPTMRKCWETAADWHSVDLIRQDLTAQLTHALRGPDNQKREQSRGVPVWGGALVGGLQEPVYRLVEARLSACSLKCQPWCFLPENLPADQYVCFSNQSVQACDSGLVWTCSSCCWYFTGNWQFVSPHFVRSHSLGDFYFITIIFLPSRSQNAICHPTVTVTPHKDGLFVSNSMNPWQRCQAMLNAAPIFHASPPSLSPPAEC